MTTADKITNIVCYFNNLPIQNVVSSITWPECRLSIFTDTEFFALGRPSYLINLSPIILIP
jgi:hypothetical protein